MGWNAWMRQIHRWLSIFFTAIPVGIFIAIGMGTKLAAWIYYLPLFPLALLVLTGLYLFVLPYTVRRRGSR